MRTLRDLKEITDVLPNDYLLIKSNVVGEDETDKKVCVVNFKKDLLKASDRISNGGNIVDAPTGVLPILDASKLRNLSASEIKSGTLNPELIPFATTSKRGSVILATSGEDTTKAATASYVNTKAGKDSPTFTGPVTIDGILRSAAGEYIARIVNATMEIGDSTKETIIKTKSTFQVDVSGQKHDVYHQGRNPSFLNLVDTPSSYAGAALQFLVVKEDGTGLEYAGSVYGRQAVVVNETEDGLATTYVEEPVAGTFVALQDTPSTYAGQAGKTLVVNSTEDGLEFAVPSSGGGGSSYAADEHEIRILPAGKLYGSDGQPLLEMKGISYPKDFTGQITTEIAQYLEAKSPYRFHAPTAGMDVQATSGEHGVAFYMAGNNVYVADTASTLNAVVSYNTYSKETLGFAPSDNLVCFWMGHGSFHNFKGFTGILANREGQAVVRWFTLGTGSCTPAFEVESNLGPIDQLMSGTHPNSTSEYQYLMWGANFTEAYGSRPTDMKVITHVYNNEYSTDGSRPEDHADVVTQSMYGTPAGLTAANILYGFVWWSPSAKVVGARWKWTHIVDGPIKDRKDATVKSWIDQLQPYSDDIDELYINWALYYGQVSANKDYAATAYTGLPVRLKSNSNVIFLEASKQYAEKAETHPDLKASLTPSSGMRRRSAGHHMILTAYPTILYRATSTNTYYVSDYIGWRGQLTITSPSVEVYCYALNKNVYGPRIHYLSDQIHSGGGAATGQYAYVTHAWGTGANSQYFPFNYQYEVQPEIETPIVAGFATKDWGPFLPDPTKSYYVQCRRL